VRHLKEYRKSDTEGSEIVLEPTEEPVRIIVFYSALVKVVELQVGGRMMQGDTTVLTREGWSFKVREEEKIRAIFIATILEKLLALPEPETPLRSQEGLTYSQVGSPFDWQDESYQLSDKRDQEDYRDSRLGLGIKEIKRRVQQDEAIFNIAKPEELMEHPWTTQQQGSGGAATGSLPGSVDGSQPVNSFTYSQKKKMKSKEQTQPEGTNLKSERLDPAFAENMRAGQEKDGVSRKRRDAAGKAWMRKLAEGDWSYFGQEQIPDVEKPDYRRKPKAD
jgi:hypothetical protein